MTRLSGRREREVPRSYRHSGGQNWARRSGAGPSARMALMKREKPTASTRAATPPACVPRCWKNWGQALAYCRKPGRSREPCAPSTPASDRPRTSFGWQQEIDAMGISVFIDAYPPAPCADREWFSSSGAVTPVPL